MTSAAAGASLALLAACLTVPERCPDGSICPLDMACAPGGGCATPEQLAACAGALEDATCEVGGLDGLCTGGACRFFMCGDGLVGGPEDCEGDQLAGASCETLGFYGGELACGTTCRYDTRACAEYCGDGIVNGDELCDGAPPDQDACVDYGYGMGAVACTEACGVSFASCTPFGWRRQRTDDEGIEITDAFAVAPTAIAAIGRVNGNSVVITFDGEAWTRLPAPVDAPSYSAFHVWATRADQAAVMQVWVTGRVNAEGAPYEAYQWDGATWTRWPLQLAAPAGVWGTSGRDVWIATQGWAQHVDGVQISAPYDLGASGGSILGGSGPDDVWSMGSTYFTRWDGRSWTAQAASASVSALAVLGPSRALACGYGLHRFDGAGWNSVFGVGESCAGLWASSGRDALTVAGGLRHWNGAGWGTVVDGVPDAIRVTGAADTPIVLARGGVWTPARRDDTDPASGAFWVHRGIGPQVGVAIAGDTDWTFDSYKATIWHAGSSVFFDGGVAAIWAFDANTAVGVGNTGLSCGFTQNGCVAAAVSGDLRAVWGPAPDFVIAVGAGGAIRHRVDGTWSEIASPTTVELTAVAGRSPTDAYAAGAGVVLRWDGVAWTVVQDAPLAPGDRVRAAFADADGTWFAVPSGLWRLTDAGWDASPWDVRDVLSISGTAADDVFAVSDEGVVHFDGQRWTPVRLPVPDATFVAVAASPRRVVFVGDDQYVLRR